MVCNRREPGKNGHGKREPACFKATKWMLFPPTGESLRFALDTVRPLIL